jgi:integrase
MRHENKGVRKLCSHKRSAWAGCKHPWHFNYKPSDPARLNPESKDGGYRFSLDKHFGEHIDSKTKAEELAGDLRKAIRAGTFGQPVARADMTLRQLADTYLDRYVKIEHPKTVRSFEYSLNGICKADIPRPTGGSAVFGDWRLADIVTDTVHQFREVRLAHGTGVVGVNRNLRQLRALFTWAIPLGYVTGTPFKFNGERIKSLKLAKEVPRNRRLQPGEEQQLLDQCSPYLRAVIVAAIDTGLRHGEILSLQWQQVEGMQVNGTTITWAPTAALFLPALKTKTKKDRRIPISARLKAILEMRRIDPSGQPMAANDYAFGSEIGTRVAGFKRAWYTVLLKAHGYTPTYAPGASLSAESQAALRTIGLHFHDLRREAGSRWMDGGVPLATIQRWLGHANISMTSTYLAGTSASEDDAHRRYEEHQAALQRIATKAGTGGKKRLQSVAGRKGKINKDAVGRGTTIM